MKLKFFVICFFAASSSALAFPGAVPGAVKGGRSYTPAEERMYLEKTCKQVNLELEKIKNLPPETNRLYLWYRNFQSSRLEKIKNMCIRNGL